MAKNPVVPNAEKQSQPESKERRIEFGSQAHADLLAGAYGMTVEEAKQIIEERDDDPNRHPYEVYKKAKAMLDQLKHEPVAISTDPGWKRDDRVIDSH